MMTLGLLVSLTVTFLLEIYQRSFAGGTETGLKSNEKSYVTEILSTAFKKIR